MRQQERQKEVKREIGADLLSIFSRSTIDYSIDHRLIHDVASSLLGRVLRARGYDLPELLMRDHRCILNENKFLDRLRFIER